MSSTSSQLTVGGSAYMAFRGANIPFDKESKLMRKITIDEIRPDAYGLMDGVITDEMWVGSGRPLTYGNVAVLWPQIAPVIGTDIFGGDTDYPFVWNAADGTIHTFTRGAITKMPDLNLGCAAPVVGDMEITGIIGNGMDPQTAGAYYMKTTGVYVPPPVSLAVSSSLPNLARQKYTASWGTNAGMTTFKAYDGFRFSHKYELEWMKPEGRTRCARVISYQVSMRCIPIDPTTGNLITAWPTSGVTAAKHGMLLSQQASKTDLVVAGETCLTATIKNAVINSGGFVFGAKPLRNGEFEWINTLDISGGAATAAFILA